MKRNFGLIVAGVALPTAIFAADFDAAQATNQTGLDLYRQLSPAQVGKNLAISPYSIASALALAYAGAEGITRAEMAHSLHFPEKTEELQPAFSKVRTAFDQMAQQSNAAAETRRQRGGAVDPIEWRAANRLFGQQGYAFRDSFLTLMETGFASPFETLDFRKSAESARGTINAWVQNQTRDKIRNLIPAGGLTPDTRLVLVNALYLKAPWQKPFELGATQPQPFHVNGGEAREVATMQTTTSLGYADEDGFTMVSIPYLGEELQFVILLPAPNQTVDSIMMKLTPADIARWARTEGENRSALVSLYLPKFRLAGATVSLGQSLRALGMKSAFDEPKGSADFSRIAARKPNDYLGLSDVFHQTFIELDENGTEAAAATAMVMMSGRAMAAPSKPIEVRIDRPFIFLIQHRASGTCLFLGRITDPQ
jgi:serpin B